MVVDNGSTDDSTTWLKEHHPSVRVVELDENKGFAGGYNDGLERVTADVFVLLNSDVRVSPNWIPPVLEMMHNEGYVACQPLIRNDTDPELFEYAGAAGGFIDRDGFTFCAGRISRYLKPILGNTMPIVRCFGPLEPHCSSKPRHGAKWEA